MAESTEIIVFFETILVSLFTGSVLANIFLNYKNKQAVFPCVLSSITAFGIVGIGIYRNNLFDICGFSLVGILHVLLAFHIKKRVI